MPGSTTTTSGVARLAVDVGLPLVTYYSLHAFGVSDRVALIAAAVAAGGRLLWEALARRRVTWFAAVMLAVFGAGVLLTFTGGDARMILLKDSVGTAMIGTVFLLSLLGREPFTLSSSHSWRPGQAEQLAALYGTVPGVRRAFRMTTLGWGLGMLGESALRVPLIYLLPVEVMVGLSSALMIAVMATLTAWTVGYLVRSARRTPQLRVLLPTGRGSVR
ncbi:VC0807 family protein [Microlunatus soli]|uniref:Intracellular septation protein A n=1 Tax=Microlunatus soli TaxID=630515 RepID=A0A1H1N0V6_9ACTN|nr:VC0807 family protein [Microlunatus soli]SDR92693.1 hypothetical protein SAMN04489812_0334 [Microlunatus soli]